MREFNQQKETFVRHTEGTFKTRFNHNHTSSHGNSKHKHSTELSNYIWQLKQSNIQYSIRWKFLKRCKAYSNKTKRCNLCLHEKFIIIYYPKLSSLNSRNELISACRHRKKFLLCNQYIFIYISVHLLNLIHYHLVNIGLLASLVWQPQSV